VASVRGSSSAHESAPARNDNSIGSAISAMLTSVTNADTVHGTSKSVF